MRFVVPLMIMVACDPTGDGTSIGNPNKTLLRVAPAGEVVLTSAELTVRELVVDGVSLQVPAETDVLEGVELDLPRDLESITLVLDGTFDLLGGDGEARIDLNLDVQRVSIVVGRQPLELDQPHVFELATPDWLSAEQVGWTRGQDHIVRPGDPFHEGLVTAVEGSRFHLDADGDGVPDGR